MSITITEEFKNKDGVYVKIVGRTFTDISLKVSSDVDVYYRKNERDRWNLCSNTPAPGWKQMSCDEYIKRGRSEMFRYATQGQLLRIMSEAIKQQKRCSEL